MVIHTPVPAMTGYLTVRSRPITRQHETRSRSRKVRENNIRCHVLLHITFLALTFTLILLTLHAQTLNHTQIPKNQQLNIHTTQTSLARSTPWQPYGALIHTTTRQINTPGTLFSSCYSFAVISALMLTLALIPQIPVLCTRAVKWGQGAIQCDNYCERSEHAG